MARSLAVTCTVLGGFALLLLSVPAVAQPAAPHGLTFRGAPRDVTRGFLITEFCLAARLKGRVGRYLVSHATWDVGYMRNVGERWAVGGTLFLSTDDHFNEAYFIALKPRLRRWLAGRLSADLSVGATLGNASGRNLDFEHPGLVGHVGFGFGDWASIVVQYEDIKYSYTYQSAPATGTLHERNWYFGVNLGSYPGAVMAPLALAAVLFVRSIEWD